MRFINLRLTYLLTCIYVYNSVVNKDYQMCKQLPRFTHLHFHEAYKIDVHGNGNNWDPMGPAGFPWEWK